MSNVAPPDPRNVIGHVPGKLCFKGSGDTIDLSTAYPHGGTAVGEIARAECVVDAPVELLRKEEHGNAVFEGISGGEAWAIAALLREHDQNALPEMFLNVATGATSGRPLVTGTGSNRAGYQYSKRATTWIFSPNNPDRHPFVVFHTAFLIPESGQRIAMRLGGATSEWSLAIVLVAMDDGSVNPYSMGMRSDISV